MSEQDHSELINRAIRLVRETYVNSEQPWYWSRQQLRVRHGFCPDAILVHAEESLSYAVEPEDALVHAIAVGSEECALYLVDEYDDVSFPLLEDAAEMPGNYRWLVIPEDLDIDEETMDSLLEGCGRQGIGLIVCYTDEDYDEVYLIPDTVAGEFVTSYLDANEIIEALSKQASRPPTINNPEENEEEKEGGEEEYDHESLLKWDRSGDYN